MRPILLYRDGIKSGGGYDSGEFDIRPNGSLIVETVTVKHESVYTVTKFITSSDPIVSYDVSVYTTGK